MAKESSGATRDSCDICFWRFICDEQCVLYHQKFSMLRRRNCQTSC